jgi:hypothetical protein
MTDCGDVMLAFAEALFWHLEWRKVQDAELSWVRGINCHLKRRLKHEYESGDARAISLPG